MGYHNVRFPTDASWGTSGGPAYRTIITSNDSGVEDRVSRWENARRSYNITYSTREYQALATLNAFFLAREGAAHSFPYKDNFDYHSNPIDPSFISAPGTRDQALGTGDGVRTTFQLVKTYVSGLTEKVRVIRKPVAGTVLVWVAGAAQLSGWTVDLDTGLITFTSAPTGLIEASFEFDVPVRFAEDTDAGLFSVADTFGEGSIHTLTLVEDVNPSPGYVDRYFTGGALDATISADLTISTSLARVYHLQASTTGLVVKMPSPVAVPTGWPIFMIVNTGSNTFTVKDHSGATLATLTTNQGCMIALTEQASAARVWIAI